MEKTAVHHRSVKRLALHGWMGLSLIIIFWTLNWTLSGPRTHWGFFPLWLGYCLAVDALVLRRTGTSLLSRSWKKYIGLFLASAPAWWLFEAINLRTQNWFYQGAEIFSPQAYAFWATLSFSTVVPAVFGTAELVRSFPLIERMGKGPVIRPDRKTTLAFLISGVVMLALMMAWPVYFFPFVWLSVYFIMEPLNIWLGNRSLADWTKRGDWRPIVSLWTGAVICGFFWEMWNYFSYPRWIYEVPFVGVGHIFEMPVLGYGGYMPFALELFALYHLAAGLLGHKRTRYVYLDGVESKVVGG
jgi:hypothetical protein